MQLKRTFLLGVIGSLALAALLGIWVFLFGNFGDIEAKIILSTLTAALYSLTSMGAAIVLERGRWRAAMISTFALSATGFLVYLAMIWFEPRWDWPWWDFMAKVMIALATWSVALPHMALLSMAPLRGVYLWARRAAVVSIALLGLSITICSIVEGEPDEDFWIREIGVFGILTALGTITVPIFMKVAGIEQEDKVESTSLDIRITCPRCLLEQSVPTGHSRCAGCKLRFEIRIEEPRCPQCDYLLHKLTAPVCPECGLFIGREEVVAAERSSHKEVHDG